MVPLHVQLLILAAGCAHHISAIMVPTGKIGGITPPKYTSYTAPLSRGAYHEPAPVWERVDEGPNPYQPPMYQYTLWNFVQKYGHHTLIARDEDYYNPTARAQPNNYLYRSNSKLDSVGKSSHTSFAKGNYYYSPLQGL